MSHIGNRHTKEKYVFSVVGRFNKIVAFAKPMSKQIFTAWNETPDIIPNSFASNITDYYPLNYFSLASVAVGYKL